MYVPNSFQPILSDTVEVVADLSFQPQPSHIVDYAIKSLKNKEIRLMKLWWEESHLSEATWELELEIQENYLHLFK